MAECFRAETWRNGCKHIPLGDSKILYQPSVGLATLEAGLLAFVNQLQPAVDNLATLLRAVQHCEEPYTSILDAPAPLAWYAGLNRLPVPSYHDGSEISRLATITQTRLKSLDIKLIGMRVYVISEATFNSQVDRLGSKGQLLSQATLQLVRTFCSFDDSTIEIFCDRQGGRKNYLPILLEAFPNEWFVETTQSKERCSYYNSRLPSRIFHFTVGGDSFPPTALASMLCKYLRERLMESFNNFWRGHIPHLRSTAGYPLDAKRFRREIEPLAKSLNFDIGQWWRSR